MLIENRKDLLKALKEAEVVALCDISNYDWSFSHNGGKYMEIYTYAPIDKNTFACIWSTTCELLPDKVQENVNLHALWKEVIRTSHNEDYEVWITSKDGSEYMVAPI